MVKVCPNCGEQLTDNMKYCNARCYCEFNEGNNICGVVLERKGSGGENDGS